MDYGSEVTRRFDAAVGDAAPPEGAPGAASGEAEDRALNVWVRVHVQLDEGRIEAARFHVFGCPHTIAAAGWAAERLEGREAASLTRIGAQQMARALDVPVEKMGKLLRIEDALLACWSELAALGLVEKGS